MPKKEYSVRTVSPVCVISDRKESVEMVNKTKSGQGTPTDGKAPGWSGDANTKAKSARKMRTIETDFFKFDDEHKFLGGVLVSRTPVTIRGNPTIRYVIEQQDGNPVAINGTTDINDKLANVVDGAYIEITALGTQKTGVGRDMKTFKVEVDES